MTPESSDLNARPTSRAHAARCLLSRQQLRDSIALAPNPSMHVSMLTGIQSALTGLIALPLVHLSPVPHLIGYAALGTLVALFGRFAPQGQRMPILLQCAFWQIFAVVVMSTAGWLGAPTMVLLLLLAVLCGLFMVVSNVGNFGPPGPLIFIFAANAAMQVPSTSFEIFERGAATTIVAALALLICWLTERFRRAPAPAAGASEPARPMSHQLVSASRLVACTAIVALVAYAGGAAYPGWAAMGAVAVMMGAHLHINMSRALQRLVGTIVGALLVGLVLSQSPSVWTIIAILTPLAIATEIVIGTNYAFGQALVTPMALLMTYLATMQSEGLVPERVLATLAGTAIAMVFVVVLSSLDDRKFLAERFGGG